MANYYCTCRSSYFKVKDEKKFLDWVSKTPGIETRDKAGQYAIFGKDGDGGGWPCYRAETDEEFDFFDEFTEHLAKGWCAIFMEAGAEKLRYTIAQAIIVDWRGKVKVIDANYEARKSAKRMKLKFGECEY